MENKSKTKRFPLLQNYKQAAVRAPTLSSAIKNFGIAFVTPNKIMSSTFRKKRKKTSAEKIGEAAKKDGVKEGDKQLENTIVDDVISKSRYLTTNIIFVTCDTKHIINFTF